MEKVMLSKNEYKAKTSILAEKYNISMATARRAKQRGYFMQGYHHKATPINRTIETALLALLSHSYWNYAGFEMQRTISNVKAGRSHFSMAEGKQLLKEITAIKQTISPITEYALTDMKYTAKGPLWQQLKKLMDDKRVKTIPLFGGNEQAVQVTDNLRKGFPIKKEQASSVVTALRIELLEFYEVLELGEKMGQEWFFKCPINSDS